MDEGEHDQLSEVILCNLGYIQKTQTSDNTGCLGSVVKVFQILIEMGSENNLRSVNSQTDCKVRPIRLAWSCANPVTVTGCSNEQDCRLRQGR